MENLFIDILEITLPISALIALLMLCSPFLKRNYVSKWRYFMWLFVAARLILPFKLKSPITMEIPSGMTVASAVTDTVKQGISVSQLLTAVWIAGMILFAAYQTVCYISFKRLVKRWKENVTDNRVLSEFEAAKRFAGINKYVEIKKCKVISTPMIFGIIKPVLLLPNIEFSNEELPIILRHELVHLKRHDIWYKLFLMAARTIHWFNPMVHIMSRAANKDMELACDAEVVKSENALFRRQYCETILHLVHNGCGAKTSLSTCFFFSKKTVMERFKNILDEKIKRNGVIMFCVIAFSICISGGIVSFATERVAEEIEDNLQIVERPTDAPKETEQPIENPTAEPVTEDVSNKPDTVSKNEQTSGQNTQANSVSAYTEIYADSANAENAEIDDTAQDEAAEEESINDVSIGDERSNIYDKLGEPDTVSGDGSKETYSLPDGNTAVLQYDGDVLDTGYIVVD